MAFWGTETLPEKAVLFLFFNECRSAEWPRATTRKSTDEPQRKEEKETKRHPADQRPLSSLLGCF